MNWLVNGWAHYIGPLPLELYAQVIAHLASLGFGHEKGPEDPAVAALSPSGLAIEGPGTLGLKAAGGDLGNPDDAARW